MLLFNKKHKWVMLLQLIICWFFHVNTKKTLQKVAINYYSILQIKKLELILRCLEKEEACNFLGCLGKHYFSPILPWLHKIFTSHLFKLFLSSINMRLKQSDHLCAARRQAETKIQWQKPNSDKITSGHTRLVEMHSKTSWKKRPSESW